MKLHFSLFLLVSACNAFAPSSLLWYSSRNTRTSLAVTETADAVAAAKEATEKFGATSPEARVAWELVEEIDASNSHEKSQKAAEEAAAAAAAAAAAEAALEPCAEPIVRQDNSEAVKLALEASEMFGKTSKEARLAWDLVEELDAANSHHRSGDIHVKLEEEDCTIEERAAELEKTAPPTTVEEAIARAQLVSDVYGKHSTDAKMAWELVEEMDATSSHIRDDSAAKEKAAKTEEVLVEKELPKVYKDTSDAIKAAMAATKEYGASSTEARLAWELVEEIDSANAHHKTVGSG